MKMAKPKEIRGPRVILDESIVSISLAEIRASASQAVLHFLKRYGLDGSYIQSVYGQDDTPIYQGDLSPHEIVRNPKYKGIQVATTDAVRYSGAYNGGIQLILPETSEQTDSQARAVFPYSIVRAVYRRNGRLIWKNKV